MIGSRPPSSTTATTTTTICSVQAYIESENRRLEKDPLRSFDSREIHIRMECRFCPNMILIDTPGLIHAPSGDNLNSEQRAVAAVSLVLKVVSDETERS